MALANQLGLTSKVVSERHFEASQEKFTAGEAAKVVGKQLKVKISAKGLVDGYQSLTGRLPEWHHSGFYKGSGNKSTMGKTYFFDDEDIEMLVSRWDEIVTIIAADKEAKEIASKTIVKGFYYYWDYDYSGNYGKKRNYKVLGVYEGSELGKPSNFTTLTDGEFLSAKLKEGAKYYGWEEPTTSDFESISKIKYNRILKARIQAEIDRKTKIENDKIEREILTQKWAKEKEDTKTAKLLLNPTNYIPKGKEIDIIKCWVSSSFIHPCPPELLKLKQDSGLNWMQFKELSKNKWSYWVN